MLRQIPFSGGQDDSNEISFSDDEIIETNLEQSNDTQLNYLEQPSDEQQNSELESTKRKAPEISGDPTKKEKIFVTGDLCIFVSKYKIKCKFNEKTDQEVIFSGKVTILESLKDILVSSFFDSIADLLVTIGENDTELYNYICPLIRDHKIFVFVKYIRISTSMQVNIMYCTFSNVAKETTYCVDISEKLDLNKLVKYTRKKKRLTFSGSPSKISNIMREVLNAENYQKFSAIVDKIIKNKLLLLKNKAEKYEITFHITKKDEKYYISQFPLGTLNREFKYESSRTQEEFTNFIELSNFCSLDDLAKSLENFEKGMGNLITESVKKCFEESSSELLTNFVNEAIQEAMDKNIPRIVIPCLQDKHLMAINEYKDLTRLVYCENLAAYREHAKLEGEKTKYLIFIINPAAYFLSLVEGKEKTMISEKTYYKLTQEDITKVLAGGLSYKTATMFYMETILKKYS